MYIRQCADTTPKGLGHVFGHALIGNIQILGGKKSRSRILVLQRTIVDPIAVKEETVDVMKQFNVECPYIFQE